MKLYLTLAVLALAFAAYAEAQDAGTIEEQFSQFGSRITELTQDLAAKTQAAFQDVHNSDFAVSTRNWFQEQYEKMKASIDGL